MNVSGILVVVAPNAVETTVAELNNLEGVDVHQVDAERGRLVATIEAESIRGEVERLERIKALPKVALAELVYHHFENDRQILERLPADLDDHALPNVPAFLNG